MKRLSFVQLMITALLIISLSGLPGFAAKKRPVEKIKFPELNPMKLPKVKKDNLPNGIKLRVIRDDKLPLVNIYIMIKGGSAYDPINKVGLSGFTTQLMKIGGTKSLKSADLDKVLDSNGISIVTSSSDSSYMISLSCLKEKLDTGISILAKIMREPVFDKDKLEELKNQAISGISRRNMIASGIRSREFAKLIYGEKSPFAAQQEYEHVDNITRKDVIGRYKMFVAPDNMLVGLVGPLEMAEVKKSFEKYFGDWNAKATIPPFPEAKELKHDYKVVFAEKSDLNQVYMSIGHLGEKFDLKNRAKFRVFNSIFCKGFSSRLMNRIRVNMGLSYGVSGGIRTHFTYRGETSFGTYTKSESTLDAIKAIKDEINKIRTGTVTKKELQDAKNYFLNSQVFEYESPTDILQTSLGNEFYGIPEGADKQFLEDVKKVTAADIKEVANKYLHPDKMVIFMVGKEKDIKGDLSELGKVKKIDISIKPPKLKEKIPAATPETLEKGKAIVDSAVKKYPKAFKVKSRKTVMTMKREAMGRMMEMEMTSTNVYPDKSHVEISVMGMKIIRIVNGKKGIMIMMGQRKPIPATEIEKGRKGELRYMMKHQDQFNFQFLKEDTVDGKKYDVIYIFEKAKPDNWQKWWINKKSQLIEIEEQFSSQQGASGLIRSVKSDFKIIKGVPIAHKTKSFLKGKMIMEMAVKDVQVNPKVDKSIFSLEEKKTKK